MAPPHEKFLPKLLLQFLQLAGEGRLGDVQDPGCSGHAPGNSHAEEISQYSEFHFSPRAPAPVPPQVAAAPALILPPLLYPAACRLQVPDSAPYIG